jgi:hypothetical protein
MPRRRAASPKSSSPSPTKIALGVLSVCRPRGKGVEVTDPSEWIFATAAAVRVAPISTARYSDVFVT